MPDQPAGPDTPSITDAAPAAEADVDFSPSETGFPEGSQPSDAQTLAQVGKYGFLFGEPTDDVEGLGLVSPQAVTPESVTPERTLEDAEAELAAARMEQHRTLAYFNAVERVAASQQQQLEGHQAIDRDLIQQATARDTAAAAAAAIPDREAEPEAHAEHQMRVLMREEIQQAVAHERSLEANAAQLQQQQHGEAQLQQLAAGAMQQVASAQAEWPEFAPTANAWGERTAQYYLQNYQSYPQEFQGCRTTLDFQARASELTSMVLRDTAIRAYASGRDPGEAIWSMCDPNVEFFDGDQVAAVAAAQPLAVAPAPVPASPAQQFADARAGAQAPASAGSRPATHEMALWQTVEEANQGDAAAGERLFAHAQSLGDLNSPETIKRLVEELVAASP